MFRELLATVLQQNTNLKASLQARSLAEARELLRSSHFSIDLAIIDLDLPNEDGAEMIEELREVDIPVLALTLGQRLRERARAARAGADLVLGTAASGEEIVRAAKRLVGE